MGKQFTSEYQPKKNGRHKGPTATDWLRKLSRTKISFHNPFTNKDEIGEVNHVVAIQLILKATQDSDLASIKEYLDRTDGKVPQALSEERSHKDTKIVLIYPPGYKPPEQPKRLGKDTIIDITNDQENKEV